MPYASLVIMNMMEIEGQSVRAETAEGQCRPTNLIPEDRLAEREAQYGPHLLLVL